MKDINFFNEYIGGKKKKSEKYKAVLIVVPAVAILMLSYIAWNFYQISSLQKELYRINSFLNNKKNIEQSEQYFVDKKKLDIMNEYNSTVQKVLVEIGKKDMEYSDIIFEISSIMPGNIFVKNMNLSSQKIDITGVSKDRTSIAEWEQNISELSFIKKVHISNISIESEEDGTYLYSLNCELKDVNSK